MEAGILKPWIMIQTHSPWKMKFEVPFNSGYVDSCVLGLTLQSDSLHICISHCMASRFRRHLPPQKMLLIGRD